MSLYLGGIEPANSHHPCGLQVLGALSLSPLSWSLLLGLGLLPQCALSEGLPCKQLGLSESAPGYTSVLMHHPLQDSQNSKRRSEVVVGKAA